MAQTDRSDRLVRMPEFTLDGYRQLLNNLAGSGYALAPVNSMPLPTTTRTAYLRHDIDLHIPGVERMAEIEAELGASATYFVLLTQHYNPLYPANRAILNHIRELGHEIGLHYDLTTYPLDDADALRHLAWECSVVESIVGRPVQSISMHQPYEGRSDVLRQGSGYIHPHDPGLGHNLLYVSDSCRAWRDENLLTCFGDTPPERLLLLTHPELWLGSDGSERTAFLDRVLTENVVRQHLDFVDVTVRGVWSRHPGPRLHDAREAARESVEAASLVHR